MWRTRLRSSSQNCFQSVQVRTVGKPRYSVDLSMLQVLVDKLNMMRPGIVVFENSLAPDSVKRRDDVGMKNFVSVVLSWESAEHVLKKGPKICYAHPSPNQDRSSAEGILFLTASSMKRSPGRLQTRRRLSSGTRKSWLDSSVNSTCVHCWRVHLMCCKHQAARAFLWFRWQVRVVQPDVLLPRSLHANDSLSSGRWLWCV